MLKNCARRACAAYDLRLSGRVVPAVNAVLDRVALAGLGAFAMLVYLHAIGAIR